MSKIKYLVAGLLLAVLILCASTVHAETFIATAYDLSPASCGKYKGHPAYGITASGYNLSGHTWSTARTVSADTSVLPLGTKIQISFPAPYRHMDGIYTVRDTGGGVCGNHLDIFFGEEAHTEAIKFGRRMINVTVLRWLYLISIVYIYSILSTLFKSLKNNGKHLDTLFAFLYNKQGNRIWVL